MMDWEIAQAVSTLLVKITWERIQSTFRSGNSIQNAQQKVTMQTRLRCPVQWLWLAEVNEPVMCYCCLSWHIKARVITSWWSVNIFVSILFFLLQKPLSRSVFKKKNNKKCSEQLCNLWAYFKSFELKIDSWISCMLCSWMRLWDYSSELFKNQNPYKKWNAVVE